MAGYPKPLQCGPIDRPSLVQTRNYKLFVINQSYVGSTIFPKIERCYISGTVGMNFASVQIADI